MSSDETELLQVYSLVDKRSILPLLWFRQSINMQSVVVERYNSVGKSELFGTGFLILLVETLMRVWWNTQ